jgi:fumarate reductase subunit C
MSDGTEAAAATAPAKTYRQPLRNDWWLRRRSYFLYMVRESTVVFMVAWLVWFLYQVAALKFGGYEPPTIDDYAFIAFSVVCLFFTLWHAVTFLNLSGLILRVPIGDRYLPATVIKAVAFGGLLFVTVVGGAIMIYIGYLKL